MNTRRQLLLVLLWLSSQPICAAAATLEGIRWFDHDGFVRVVFDLSGEVDYKVSRQLEQGYVDVILRGDISRRMKEEVELNNVLALRAEQLRRTSTALTWRIRCAEVSRVSTFALDEQPYKVALDFHGPRSTAEPPGRPPAAASVEPGRKRSSISADFRKGNRESTNVPAQVESVEPAPPAKTVDPYRGLDAQQTKRLKVAELLLQLSDTTSARSFLLALHEEASGQPQTRYLLAGIHLAQGDYHRARFYLEPLLELETYRERASVLAERLPPPNDQGVLPGGEISETDLEYYIGVLRRGRVLTRKDLRSQPEQAASPPSAFLPGALAGLVLGLLCWGLSELLRRRRAQLEARKKILDEHSRTEEAPLPKTKKPESHYPDYAEVSERVRGELEEHMRSIETGGAEASVEEDAAQAPPEAESKVPERRMVDVEVSPGSVEESVFKLADERRTIVEIAEELNIGVDEVRLILELREQTDEVTEPPQSIPGS